MLSGKFFKNPPKPEDSMSSRTQICNYAEIKTFQDDTYMIYSSECSDAHCVKVLMASIINCQLTSKI